MLRVCKKQMLLTAKNEPNDSHKRKKNIALGNNLGTSPTEIVFIFISILKPGSCSQDMIVFD